MMRNDAYSVNALLDKFGMISKYKGYEQLSEAIQYRARTAASTTYAELYKDVSDNYGTKADTIKYNIAKVIEETFLSYMDEHDDIQNAVFGRLYKHGARPSNSRFIDACVVYINKNAKEEICTTE